MGTSRRGCDKPLVPQNVTSSATHICTTQGVTGLRGPQTAAQSKKDSREMLAFCAGATSPTPQQGQGMMCCRHVAPVPGWSEQLAPASAPPYLFREPLSEPLCIVLEPLVRGCSRRGQHSPGAASACGTASGATAQGWFGLKATYMCQA